MRHREEQWLGPAVPWLGFLLVSLTVSLAFAVGGCGSSGGSNAFQEGKGFPGDTEYADTVVRPYYVDNGLVDPSVPPGTVLPSSFSNESQLTKNVADQGQVGTCAAVSFAQLVYGFDVAAAAPNPYLDSVQFSYLFARYFEKNGQGGKEGWRADSGSLAFTNFQALTTPAYWATYANGFLPADGAEGAVIHPTGIFFGFEGSPNENDPILVKGSNGKETVNLNSYWNKIDLFGKLDTGPTKMAMTIRRSALSPTSLDVKARVAAGSLVYLSFDTEDSKNQWENGTHFFRTGVLELPYIQPAKPTGEAGHAMVVVGYADDGYGKYNGAGAFKVRNSWGKRFGDEGSWYLPYSIVDGVAGASEGSTYPLYTTTNLSTSQP
jgi:hypothetical protein